MSPLQDALANPEQLGELVQAMGFDAVFDPVALDGLTTTLGPLATDAQTAIDDGQAALAILGNTGLDPISRALAVDDLVLAGQALVQVAQDIGPALENVDLSALPVDFQALETWTRQVIPLLPQFLLLTWLEDERPVLFNVLRTLGIIHPDLYEIYWPELTSYLSAPEDTFKRHFRWPENAGLVATLLQDALSRLVGRARLAPVNEPFLTNYFPSEGTELRQLELPVVEGFGGGFYTSLGLVVLPVPKTPSDPISGIAVSSLAVGSVGQTFPLDENGWWNLALSGGFDGTGAATVRVYTDGDVVADFTGPDTNAQVALTFEPDEDWVLVGTPDASRVEVNGLLFAVAMETANNGDVIVQARTTGIGGPGLKVVLSPGEANSFLGSLFGGLTVEAELDLEASFSARRGFTFGHSGSLSWELPVSASLGPLTFDAIAIDVVPQPTSDEPYLDDGSGPIAEPVGINARLGANLGAELGPFQVAVQGLGMNLVLTPGASGVGSLGPFDIDVGISPPSALAFSLELPGVSGAGGLLLEPELGRYSGFLSLQAATVGLTVIGLLSLPTKTNPKPWSLLFLLTLDLQVPLGFGFTLTGVGGLIGINRTFDEDQLSLGVRTGAIDDVMFPSHPIDVNGFLDRMEAYFPEAPGNFVFGPLVELTWGPNNVIAAKLGILITFPDVRLAVLGVLSAILPDREAPILELNMAVLGVIDIPEGTLTIQASIFDSLLFQTIQLSGDMAMHVRFKSSPYFLFSVGGFHPAFEPPGHLPPSLTQLNRLRASIPISDAFEASLSGYFAITSNTFQIGGRVDIAADVKIAVIGTLSARGFLEFNAMIKFDPFRIIADASAGVTISAGNNELLGVMLAVYVEGPRSWYVRAQGSFRFLGIDVSFDIDHGTPEIDERPALWHLQDNMVGTMADPSSYRVAPDGLPFSTWDLVVCSEVDDDSSTLRVRPDGTLEVSQSLAPLERKIEIFGTYVVEGPKVVSITDAGFVVDGAQVPVDGEDVTGLFAPAQYTRMTDAERLAAPSFEEEIAGLAFTSRASDVDVGNAAVQTAEWLTYAPGEFDEENAGLQIDSVLDFDDFHLFTDGSPKVKGRKVTATAQPIEVSRTAYALVDKISGQSADDLLTDAGLSAGSSFSSFAGARELLGDAGSGARAKVRIVPAYAVVD